MLSKIVSSFSLILCLSALCLSADYRQLQQQFQSAKTSDDKIQVLENFADKSPDLSQEDSSLYQQIVEAEDNPAEFKADKLQQMIDLRVSTMTAAPRTDDVESKIKSIKSSPLYKDTGTANEENWLSKAFSRLFANRDSQPSSPATPEIPGGTVSLGSAIFTYGLIGILVAAVIFFLVLAFRHFSWQKKLKRKSSALLEEDEPERSADEWLRLAEGLTLQGRYREAVRCLYLACLLKIDEANVARFVRAETNWEHLARIQASPTRPASLDMLAPTQSFDRIWYGHQVRGEQDVDQFKIWYEEVVKTLRAEAA
jgi:Domain of unknown function (DUF4129)